MIKNKHNQDLDRLESQVYWLAYIGNKERYEIREFKNSNIGKNKELETSRGIDHICRTAEHYSQMVQDPTCKFNVLQILIDKKFIDM